MQYWLYYLLFQTDTLYAVRHPAMNDVCRKVLQEKAKYHCDIDNFKISWKWDFEIRDFMGGNSGFRIIYKTFLDVWRRKP